MLSPVTLPVNVFINYLVNTLDNALVNVYDITIVDNVIVGRRFQMVVKRAGRNQVTAQSPGTRGSLSTLFGILGAVAQTTGIGIRFF